MREPAATPLTDLVVPVCPLSSVRCLCGTAKEAALGPVRALGSRIRDAPSTAVRPVALADFTAALGRVRPSISHESLKEMEAWNRAHGSFQGSGKAPQTEGGAWPAARRAAASHRSWVGRVWSGHGSAGTDGR